MRKAQRKYLDTEKGKAKHQAYTVKWKAAHRDLVLSGYKRYDLKRHYGLTMDQYVAMWLAQEQKCAACGSTHSGRKNGQWCIDHDHGNGTPHARGIVCNGCNLILGHAKDSIPRLHMIAGYMERINDRNQAG